MTLCKKYAVQSTLFCFAIMKIVSIYNGETDRGWRKPASVLTYEKSSLKHPDGSTAFQTRLRDQSPVRLAAQPLQGKSGGVERVKGTRGVLGSAHPALPVYIHEEFMALSFLIIAHLPGGRSQVSEEIFSGHGTESLVHDKCTLCCWAAAPAKGFFYVRSSWQEALLPSLTSRSPGQLLLGRHKQQIMTLKGHTSSRAEKQFHSDGHVARSFLNVGWLVRMREVVFSTLFPILAPEPWVGV